MTPSTQTPKRARPRSPGVTRPRKRLTLAKPLSELVTGRIYHVLENLDTTRFGGVAPKATYPERTWSTEPQVSASMRARAESEQPELEEDVMSDVLEEPPVSHAPVVKREGGEASNLASSTEEDMKSSLKTTFEELVKWVDEDAGILPPVYNANGLPDNNILTRPIQDCTLHQLTEYYHASEERLRAARAEFRGGNDLLTELKQLFSRHWKRNEKLEVALKDKQLAKTRLQEAERYIGSFFE